MHPHAEVSYPLSIILQHNRLQRGQWRFPHWQLRGVLAQSAVTGSAVPACRKVYTERDGELFIWSGLALDLFRDSLYSYYQNLTAARPMLFVLCHDDDRRTGLAPISVSVDLSDAEGHMETDGVVLSTPLVTPFINWLADYVLGNRDVLDAQLREQHQGKQGKRRQAHV